MRWKYYLKGLGIGIVFATIILMISGVIHKNELSDEEIIKKAMQLGMVMPESESDSGLFGDKNSETVKPSETEETEAETVTEETEETEETEKPELPSESEKPSEPESQEPPQHVVIEQFVLHIVYGDMPKDVAKKLYNNGYVDSIKDFQYYLGDYCKKHGVDMRTGKFTITKGMSYEEIAKIITKNK